MRYDSFLLNSIINFPSTFLVQVAAELVGAVLVAVAPPGRAEAVGAAHGEAGERLAVGVAGAHLALAQLPHADLVSSALLVVPTPTYVHRQIPLS